MDTIPAKQAAIKGGFGQNAGSSTVTAPSLQDIPSKAQPPTAYYEGTDKPTFRDFVCFHLDQNWVSIVVGVAANDAGIADIR